MDDTTTPAPTTKQLRDVLPNAVDGAGLPQFAIDSRTVHEQRRMKGYIVTLCWMLDPEMGRADAAMVLFPERRFSDAGAWAVTRRGIRRFCDEHNRPTEDLIREAQEALPMLGYDLIRAEVIRFLDVVMAHVDDLVLMPAPPLGVTLLLQGDPVWDVTVHAQGSPNKVLREAII